MSFLFGFMQPYLLFTPPLRNRRFSVYLELFPWGEVNSMDYFLKSLTERFRQRCKISFGNRYLGCWPNTFLRILRSILLEIELRFSYIQPNPKRVLIISGLGRLLPK
jgi:hypothetical protein